ncbi:MULTISPECIES: Crp/Fnr family transcriptional regulator [unclassified Myroides]|uniref:Crp/Fnr family transcriptional regulator n=1 Tax=unclassified Myroides TaxID=2642485 RepID=UPI003D2F6498
MIRTNETFLNYIDERYKQQLDTPDAIAIVTYAPGDYLFLQNESASSVLLIKRGVTKVFFEEENEKEYIVEFLGKGEVIGDIEYIRKIDALCNVQALDTVEVYVLSYPFFQSLLAKDSVLCELLLDAFAARIVNTARRASFQQLYTIEYSLHQLVEMQKKQDLTLSKEDMAAYLGISVRSLNRSLNQRKEEREKE